jgi:pyruvate kinase
MRLANLRIALTRHRSTCSRFILCRGVYLIEYDIINAQPEVMYPKNLKVLLDRKLVGAGDLIIPTKD